MSINREACVWHGWIINVADFLKLCEHREEVTHEEPRFDPKTGEPTKPVIIVDEEAGYYWHDMYISHKGWIYQVQEWLEKQDIDLDVAAMQWNDGDFCQIIIGVEVDDKVLEDIQSFSQEQVEFVAKHFNTNNQPRIAAFMVVD